MKRESHNPPRKEIRAFLEKIVVDIGVGRLSQTPNFEEKALVQVAKDIATVTGQKAELRRAKKSIAGFKLREGTVVGLRVTLRREKMVDFFERLITIVLPRVRDFNGIDPKNLDTGGTLNMGIREHAVFPEIIPEQSPVSFPLGMSIVPKLKNRDKAFQEFTKLGVPFKREKKK